MPSPIRKRLTIEITDKEQEKLRRAANKADQKALDAALMAKAGKPAKITRLKANERTKSTPAASVRFSAEPVAVAKKQSWADVAVRGVAVLSASTLMGMGGYFALSAHSLWPLLIPGVLPGAFIMLPAIFGGGANTGESGSALDGVCVTETKLSVGGQPLVGFFDADGNGRRASDFDSGL